MNRNTKISIIGVCMDENYTTKLFCILTKMLQLTFDEAKVLTSTNIQTVENLKTDVILVLGAPSLRNTIIGEIDKISDAKTKITKLFAEIPILLRLNISESLYCAYRKNAFIFFVMGNNLDIIESVVTNKNVIVLGAYLLRNIITISDGYIPHERNQIASLFMKMKVGKDQMMSSNSSGQSSFSKKEEKKDISISPNSTSPKTTNFSKKEKEKDMSILCNSSSPKNLQIDKANIHAPTNQMIRLPRLVSVDDAFKIMCDVLIVPNDNEREIERVDIKNSFGKQICEKVTCPTNVPLFSVATEHGYAVVVDTDIEKMEGISDESSKINSIILDPVTTKWVNSGEFIPSEAIAIIPADDVAISYDDKGNEIKTTSHPIKYGQNIRFLGSDIEEEETILYPNIRMGSMEIGLLTACGLRQVNVIKEIPIGVLTIGNKLQEPGEPLEPEHSYDSNRAILISLLKENGFNSLDFGISIKDSTTIIQKIKEALKTVNLLVTTSCSNDKDCLKTILKNDFNATLHFENVDIKPGKSTAFASCEFEGKTKYILCLPGNPVSVLVIAHLFLLRIVKLIHFKSVEDFTIVMAKIKQKLPLHSRPQYVWATLSWPVKERFAQVTCKVDSSMNKKLFNIIDANALLILPAKTSKGDTASSFVQAILIKFPFSVNQDFK
ncbi:gephyrin-like isoform X2 [Linepithema humile]|uniref:gephyrin-like isoform X2 n=1 Tax=Linepithema humile TaxID=83485 RepID=UPI00351E3396